MKLERIIDVSEIEVVAQHMHGSEISITEHNNIIYCHSIFLQSKCLHIGAEGQYQKSKLSYMHNMPSCQVF